MDSGNSTDSEDFRILIINIMPDEWKNIGVSVTKGVKADGMYVIDKPLDVMDKKESIRLAVDEWATANGFVPSTWKGRTLETRKEGGGYLMIVIYGNAKYSSFQISIDGNLATSETMNLLSTKLKEIFTYEPPAEVIPDDLPVRDVPSGSTDPILYTDISDGDLMVDFDNEYSFGRYYLASTYKHLKKKNPFKGKPIDESTVTKYKAKIVDSGGRRYRKTRKTRKTRRTRNASRKTHRR